MSLVSPPGVLHVVLASGLCSALFSPITFVLGINRHFQELTTAEIISPQLSSLQLRQTDWSVLDGALFGFQKSWVPCWGVEGTPRALVPGSSFSRISSDTASVAFLEEVPKAGLLVSMAATAEVIVASTDLIHKKFTEAISKQMIETEKHCQSDEILFL